MDGMKLGHATRQMSAIGSRCQSRTRQELRGIQDRHIKARVDVIVALVGLLAARVEAAKTATKAS